MQNTEVTIQDLISMIGQLTIEKTVLQQRITIIQAELDKERQSRIDDQPFAEPVRVPRRPDNNVAEGTLFNPIDRERM